jgi:hypothetical protein
MGKETSITVTLALPENVIPAKAGIQKDTGFRVKPGMTTRTGLLSSRDFYSRWNPIFHSSIIPEFSLGGL